MSDINMLYTAQAKTTATLTAQGQGNGLPKGNGLFSGAGMNFFDLLFARNLTDKGPESSGISTLTTVAADTPALETSVTAVTDNTLTFDPSLMDTAIDADLSVTSEIPAMPEEAGKKLAAILENLLQGLPADQRPVVVNIKGGELKQALKTLNINPQDISAESQNLIATGLSPEDITRLQEFLSGDQATEMGEGIEAFVVGMVKILPDGAKGETIFLPKSLILTKTEEIPSETAEPTDEIAAMLNALDVGGTPPAAQPPAQPVLTAGATLTGDGMAAETANDQRGGFDDVLKLLEQIQSKTDQLRSAAGIETASADKAAKPSAMNSTLGSSFHGMLGSMMSDLSLGDYFPEGFDWAKSQPGAIPGTNVTGPAQLTSLVTQAQSATQPHPATQVVAATLTRAAQGGEDKTLKLQLDPPELGRIEVHMHFSKDKTMKAHMVIEKPETMLMMQRDSHVLERALQDAGLDTSGSGLSFELSAHDDNFGGDRHGSGQSGHGGGRSDDNAPSEIIETIMTWHVDEATGHQRYNILA